jgi:transposase
VPGQRQGIRAASAVSAQGAFGFITDPGGLNGEWFVTFLRRLMRGRRQPLHLILDHLPAHQTRAVQAYVARLNGKRTLHFLPG